MRRAGYTNPIQSPITWSDSAVVGETNLNIYLRNNFLAIDNRISPFLPDVVHYTPPGSSVTVDNTLVFIPSRYGGVNISALNEYSPNVALSVDASFSLESVSASAVRVEAAVVLEDIETVGSAPSRSVFRYRMYKSAETWPTSTLKEPPIVATNFISGPHLGNTDYGFWSGYVKQDIIGNSPFSLTKPTFSVQAMLAISATNGSVVVRNPSWGLRFRTNVGVSVVNPATNFVPDVWIFGSQAV